MKTCVVSTLLAAAMCVASPASANITSAGTLPRLAVSPDGHFLMRADGSPFFYLGDTAWELFHRLSREEVDAYLSDRASKGFTVIQAVALAELSGLDVPNAYGHLPLRNGNPLEPDTCPGADNDYWDHVDYVVHKANALGMYVGLLPTWGSHWNDGSAVFNVANAEAYGRFMAQRYGRCGVIWILGGDRNPDDARRQDVIRAMARGIRSVDTESLITFHPTGWRGSSEWFHGEEWLSFNGRQNGHTPRYESYGNTLRDYRLAPVKPVVDLEPLYEDHPIEFRPDEEGHSTAGDVRRALYWDVFNGACGVTYGHHSVWQMYDPAKGRNPINRPLYSWRQALAQPASRQAGYLRKLIESRPYFTRVPSPEFIVPGSVESAVPGVNGRDRMVATIDSNGRYAMVYSPVGRTFSVRGDMLKASRLRIWRFDPRTCKAEKVATVRNDGKPILIEPYEPNEALDVVWVIDDAAAHFPAPGSKAWRH